ncbi:MAG: hypothetical protein QOI09_2236, partial [Chloroflexota bacterium]|nr:hypothetical protein [Chloroflexota bacterium]
MQQCSSLPGGAPAVACQPTAIIPTEMSGRIARPGGQLVAEAGADPLITPGVRDL